MLAAKILIAAMASLAAAVPAPQPAGYTGPCSPDNCGIQGTNCGKGYLCVPFPHMDPELRQGCTCSLG